MGASGEAPSRVLSAQSRGQRSLSSLKIQHGHWFMVPGRLEDGGFPDGEIALWPPWGCRKLIRIV